MQVDPGSVLVLSAILFAIGVFGVISRRGAVVLLMGVELMLNAGNLALVAAARVTPAGGELGAMDGQVLAFLVLAIAAAEAAVGLALVIALFRHKGSVDVDLARMLRW